MSRIKCIALKLVDKWNTDEQTTECHRTYDSSKSAFESRKLEVGIKIRWLVELFHEWQWQQPLHCHSLPVARVKGVRSQVYGNMAHIGHIVTFNPLRKSGTVVVSNPAQHDVRITILKEQCNRVPHFLGFRSHNFHKLLWLVSSLRME
jgi:hypothetical protein